MKQKIMLVLFLFCFLIVGHSSPTKFGNKNFTSTFFFKRIDKTYHSTNGYTIRIVGDLNHNWSYTSWSFSGKVYITGNGQNIVLHLELTSPEPIPSSVGELKNNYTEYASVEISGNGTSATSAVWTTGNQVAYDVLNSQEIIDAFIADVNFETFN